MDGLRGKKWECFVTEVIGLALGGETIFRDGQTIREVRYCTEGCGSIN